MARTYKVRSVDSIDWEKTPVLEGKVLSMESIKVGEEERDVMVIDTGSQKVRVFHSAALDEAFSMAELGDSIRLEFRGKVALKGGKTFNRFSVAVWTGEDVFDGKEAGPKAP